MDAYLRPLVLCSLHLTLIGQRNISMLDDWLNKNVWNQRSQISVHAIEYKELIYIYIYIYIYTNLISTSIHGTRKKRKKNRQKQEIKVSRITARGKKKKKYRSKRKKRPTSSDPLKKIKGYAVSWSKEN